MIAWRRMLAVSVLAAVGSPALATESAVILMYHRFGEDRYPSTSVTLAQFYAHLAWLSEADYTVVPLTDVLAATAGKGAGKQKLPERAVAITVDDAYRSVYDVAFPLLRERGWPFTVFVSTDAVDAGLAAYMTWDQLRAMRKAGVSFAHHSATHDSLIERREGESAEDWRARITADLDRGAQRLTAELGKTAPQFAYPYGEYDRALATLVTQRGWTAFGQQSGAVGPHSDPRALPRFPMAEAFAAIGDFKTKVATLPLAVAHITPWDPVTTDRRPRLEVTLAVVPDRIAELACFVSGQGKVEVEWLEPRKRFAVQAPEPLPRGRSRYNCTVPSPDGKQYHWFSQQWVLP